MQRKAQLQRKAGKLDAAAETLMAGIRIAAASLADLHGTLGGTFREQGRLAEATKEYDCGYRLEQRYGILSSYNALNRLLTRLMADAPEPVGATLGKRARNRDRVDIDEELRRVQEQLTAQLRESDAAEFWVAGDLAVVAALNGDQRAMKAGLALFMVPATPRFAYEGYLKTVPRLLSCGHSRNRGLRTLHRELLRGIALLR
ncbi:MAG: hypothetical protein HY348_06850 [Nitrospira defluvii]|nr:hypothetical protein [Nitrospira defluvii]